MRLNYPQNSEPKKCIKGKNQHAEELKSIKGDDHGQTYLRIQKRSNKIK